MQNALVKDSETYFKELGQRIAHYRKAIGLSQRELAAILDIKQQVLAAYETGIRRMPVSSLEPISKSLNVEVSDLLGIKDKPSKRGPNSKLNKKIEELKNLPESKQKLVLDLVETVLKAERKAS